jgi:hypothetical protein
MLKISIVDGTNQCRLVVEGKLIGPWAAELKSACEVARTDRLATGLLIDMKNVTAISQEGENVLLELMKARVKFRCRGVFTKHILRQVARRANSNPGKARK